jgi:hypothetical protein
MTKDDEDTAFMVILAVMSMIFGILIGGCTVDAGWKKSVITNGYGQYNPHSGQFEFVQPKRVEQAESNPWPTGSSR